jgi:hypothetical protein
MLNVVLVQSIGNRTASAASQTDSRTESAYKVPTPSVERSSATVVNAMMILSKDPEGQRATAPQSDLVTYLLS